MAPRLFILGKYQRFIEIIQRWSGGSARECVEKWSRDKIGRIAYVGFDVSQSFIGMLTNVNVWDHVLSPAETERMSKSCLSGEGNVYKWSDFIHGLKGETRVVKAL